jgi:hypothetical protein
MGVTDQDRHRAALASLYATRPRCRLLSVRAATSAVLVTLAKPDGLVELVRVTHADQPELDVLGPADRARVRSAVLTLKGGPPDAA